MRRRVDTNGDGGCWIWKGPLSAKGYGRVSHRGVWLGAHRVIYELIKGSVPKDLQLDHLCRVRHCVNPEHLEPVTNRENGARGLAGEWQKEKTHCPKGHEYIESNTYRTPGSGARGCKICRNATAVAWTKAHPRNLRGFVLRDTIPPKYISRPKEK
jgi:hypothetical protein